MKTLLLLVLLSLASPAIARVPAQTGEVRERTIVDYYVPPRPAPAFWWRWSWWNLVFPAL